MASSRTGLQCSQGIPRTLVSQYHGIHKSLVEQDETGSCSDSELPYGRRVSERGSFSPPSCSVLGSQLLLVDGVWERINERRKKEIKVTMLPGEEGDSKINLHLKQTFGTSPSYLRAVNNDLVNMGFDKTYFGQTRLM